MVSKVPAGSELYLFDDGMSLKLPENNGGQNSELLVELCPLCRCKMDSSSHKTDASRVFCLCHTPSKLSTLSCTVATAVSNANWNVSSKKKKCGSSIFNTVKRKLFKENLPLEVVLNDGSFSSSFFGNQEGMTEEEEKIEEEKEAKIVKWTAGWDPDCNSDSVPNKTRSRLHYNCSVCSKCFCTPGKLNQHMFVHTGEKPFVCHYCSKAFSSKFKLVRHILIHSDERQYRCASCSKTFHRKDHLQNHSKIHNPIKRVYKCDRIDCSKEYSSMLSYKRHIALHFAEEGHLECKVCAQKFESKEEIIIHLRVHTGSRSLKTPADKKYKCDQCGRSFFTGKDVRRHLVVHTGRRDFVCQYCPHRFGRKDHLTRHIKKSHCTLLNKKGKAKKGLQEAEKGKSAMNTLLEELKEHKHRNKCHYSKYCTVTTSQCEMFGIIKTDELYDGSIKIENVKNSGELQSHLVPSVHSTSDDKLMTNFPEQQQSLELTSKELYNNSEFAMVQDVSSNNDDNYKQMFPKIEDIPETSESGQFYSIPEYQNLQNISIVEPQDKKSSKLTQPPTKLIEDHLRIYADTSVDIAYSYSHYQLERCSRNNLELASSLSAASATMPTDLMFEQESLPAYPSEFPIYDSLDDIKIESSYSLSVSSSPPLFLPSPSFSDSNNVPYINSISSPPLIGNLFSNSSHISDLFSVDTNKYNDGVTFSGAAVSATSPTPAFHCNNTSTSTVTEDLFQYLPTSHELMASFLATSDPEASTTPLPGFNQAFHQPSQD